MYVGGITYGELERGGHLFTVWRTVHRFILLEGTVSPVWGSLRIAPIREETKDELMEVTLKGMNEEFHDEGNEVLIEGMEQDEDFGTRVANESQDEICD